MVWCARVRATPERIGAIMALPIAVQVYSVRDNAAADLRALAADLAGDRSQKEETLRGYRKNIDEAAGEITKRREVLAGELWKFILSVLRREF